MNTELDLTERTATGAHRRPRSPRPAPRPARRGSRGRARPRRRLPHRRQPGRQLAARRDRDRTGPSRLRQRGPRSRAADALRSDQPAHPAPPSSPRRRRPRARRVLRRAPTDVQARPRLAPVGRLPRDRPAAPGGHRVRAHRQLRDGRPAGGSSQGRPRRRHRVRHQPAARRGALPPRRQVGRQHGRLPRRRRAPRRHCSSSRQRHDPDASRTRSRGASTTSTGPRVAAGLDDVGIAATGTDPRPRRVPRARRAVRRRRAVPVDDRHGPPPLRRRASTATSRIRCPRVVAELRASFWPHLLPIARDWAARLEQPAPWPDDFDAWIAQCHAAGQTRPTPLMLRYGPGDWNALHRDLYGDLVFPLQVVIGLDCAGRRLHGRRVRRRRATTHAPSHERRRARSLTDTASCSPPGTARSDPPADGPLPRCATASARCTPASGTRWDSSSTTPSDGRRLPQRAAAIGSR